MRFTYKTSLFKVALSFVVVVFLISSSASASSDPPLQSPLAETELICHTDNPAECYPKVFSATEEFQLLHDDQELPPGLHVQLDIQTGQKQAKLYNPKEEVDPSLEGLPVDRSVVVIDPETPQEGNNEGQLPPGAPAYEPVGVVKEPREKNENFLKALQTVKERGDDAVLDPALEVLEDLAHDMYYGLQIALDGETVQALFCLLTRRDTTLAQSRSLTERHDFLASSIIASAVRNNAPALRAVENSWNTIMAKQCDSSGPLSLKERLYSGIGPGTEPGDPEEPVNAEFMRFNLAVMDGLLHSPRIRAEFLAHGGMRSFLQILLRKDDAWAPRKSKVARIVSDIFLDKDLGAETGVWPTQKPTDDSVCATERTVSMDDGCWEYQLKTLSQDSSFNQEWVEPLLSLLIQNRVGTPRPRDEL